KSVLPTSCAGRRRVGTPPLRELRPQITRRGTEHNSGLGAQRWAVERAFAHLHWFRRLGTRWEIRNDIHEALLNLACSTLCWRRLKMRPSRVNYRHSGRL
ncbi:transposase, partial [Kitasatospora sp. NPDC001539]|uniref:transposase n=1 Tax=Kitasatospora sp. NPDC001539 TaxID=3154384 RepID=UPI0033193028